MTEQTRSDGGRVSDAPPEPADAPPKQAHSPDRRDPGADVPEWDNTETDRQARRAGWRLMGATMRPQRWWVLTGIVAGLGWTAARVTIPLLAAAAIDQGILKSDEAATLRFVLIIVAVGVVQASVYRLAALLRVPHRAPGRDQPPRAAVRPPPAAALRVPRRGPDRPAHGTGEHRHAADPRLVVLLPLTAASLLTMAAVLVIILIKSPGLALLVLATLPFLNIAATRFTRRIQPVTLRCRRSSPTCPGVVEESVAGVRVVKGFGAEQVQARRLRARSRRGARAIARRGASAVWVHPAGRPAADAVAGRHPLVRRPSGPRRQPRARLPRRVQLVRPDADLAAADGRDAARPGVTVVGGRRPGPRGARDRPRDRRRHRLASAPRRSGRDPLRGRALRLRRRDRTAGARRPRPRDPRRRSRRAGRLDRARARPPSPGSCRASTTSTAVGSASTASTCARSRCRTCAAAVGIVFEDTFLFSDTVRENIAFADRGAPMDQIEEAAELAGADEFIEALPDGYDTIDR